MGIRTLFAPVAIIGMAHMLGGISVLAAHDADRVSGLSGPMLANASPYAVAATLLLVGGLAIISRVRRFKEPYYTICAAPQQFFLMLQLMGVILSAANGQYPDGFVPVQHNYWASVWFIIGDQAALIAICISHTVEMCYRQVNPDLYQELITERKDRIEAEKVVSIMQDTVFWQTVKWEDDKSKFSPCDNCSKIKMANMGIQYWGKPNDGKWTE